MTTRTWRRWLQRAEELRLTLPDPLILMQVLGRIMDSLSKLGGSQVAYRVSSVRQELLVDLRPELQSIKDLSEYLQAEMEDLSLMVVAPKTSATTSSTPSSQTAAPVVKAMHSSQGQDEKPRSPCRFWGSQSGCRRGDTCGYAHSWDGLDRQQRCFFCSGEGHMMKDCPHRQQRGTKDFKKNAKVKGVGEEVSKDSPTKETQYRNSEASGTTSSPSSSLLSSPTVSGGGSGRTVVGRRRRSWGVTKSQRLTPLLSSLMKQQLSSRRSGP